MVVDSPGGDNITRKHDQALTALLYGATRGGVVGAFFLTG